jgi:hypothetical protein
MLDNEEVILYNSWFTPGFLFSGWLIAGALLIYIYRQERDVKKFVVEKISQHTSDLKCKCKESLERFNKIIGTCFLFSCMVFVCWVIQFMYIVVIAASKQCDNDTTVVAKSISSYLYYTILVLGVWSCLIDNIASWLHRELKVTHTDPSVTDDQLNVLRSDLNICEQLMKIGALCLCWVLIYFLWYCCLAVRDFNIFVNVSVSC